MKRVLLLVLSMSGSVVHAEGEITSCKDLISKDAAIVHDHAEPIAGGQACYVRSKDGDGAPIYNGVVWDAQMIKEDVKKPSFCINWEKHFTCKIKDRVPPGEDTSTRCRQLLKHAVTPEEAKAHSAKNVAAVEGEPGMKTVLSRYRAMKKEIAKGLADAKTWKTGQYQYTRDMFPVFSGDKMCPKQPITEVNIGIPCGTYEGDFAAANSIAGLEATPKDCTWHHHEDLGVMQLVSKKHHDDERHTGGLAIWRRVIGYYEIATDSKNDPEEILPALRDYPVCCPTPEQIAEAKALKEEAEKKKKKKKK